MKTLAQVIAEHVPAEDEPTWANERLCRACGESVSILPNEWPAHVAAAWRAERTITTQEQLAGLPIGTIVRDVTEWGVAYSGNGWWTVVSLTATSGHVGDGIYHPSVGGDILDSAVGLPALVVYLPGDEETP